MNIYIKSTLRNPIHNLLLALLLGVASFAIILRFAEFTIIENEIIRIEGFYRAIGYLRNTNIGNLRNIHNLRDARNVAAGAAVVEESPFVASSDRREWYIGVLEGMQNVNVAGAIAVRGESPFLSLGGQLLGIEMPSLRTVLKPPHICSAGRYVSTLIPPQWLSGLPSHLGRDMGEH